MAGDLLHNYPWLLAVVPFFAATLFDSQAATTKALMPAALLLGVSPLTAIAFVCRGLGAVRSTDLPTPAGGGRDGRHRLNPHW
ncbi:hypothetical protein MJ560_02695 [Klebsiella pneumoniae]|nr:hypothetical protein MJ560_02695 [Klebsiella pneumoniae]